MLELFLREKEDGHGIGVEGGGGEGEGAEGGESLEGDGCSKDDEDYTPPQSTNRGRRRDRTSKRALKIVEGDGSREPLNRVFSSGSILFYAVRTLEFRSA
ncbi:hypothetical protein SUGI_0266340 [Cryptomeria japonica]|nr:hypothetical protein SUGI_0266340 [Cryptomeria japonica]